MLTMNKKFIVRRNTEETEFSGLLFRHAGLIFNFFNHKIFDDVGESHQ